MAVRDLFVTVARPLVVEPGPLGHLCGLPPAPEDLGLQAACLPVEGETGRQASLFGQGVA